VIRLFLLNLTWSENINRVVIVGKNLVLFFDFDEIIYIDFNSKANYICLITSNKSFKFFIKPNDYFSFLGFLRRKGFFLVNGSIFINISHCKYLQNKGENALLYFNNFDSLLINHTKDLISGLNFHFIKIVFKTNRFKKNVIPVF
jgi:hypothetical protein